MKSNVRNKKNLKIRHSEYYGMTQIFDTLYERSSKNIVFKKLMKIITSDNNILLAYRNIKTNKGSRTPGVDRLTIEDVEQLSQTQFLDYIKKRFGQYQPRKVKRVEIPKPNGETRPLGIPSIWDRIVQQCILQVLDPICEAKFYQHSYGFRPNRSAEQALANCHMRVNFGHLQYVVDIDVKSFFDEVNHTKLMRQLWTMGIRDKQLLVIIRKMLKAPVRLLDGSTVYPNKGTPQGGILSPLLANINLNEFDWWIANQWENREIDTIKKQIRTDGRIDKSNVYRCLRKTRLKSMFIVRYADDFKIFCRNKEEANKVFIASKMWLKERLKLTISQDKSKITNLKEEASEFLGFTFKMVKKGKQYTCHSYVAPKALQRVKRELKTKLKEMQKKATLQELYKVMSRYNSMIIGIHNYYHSATHVSESFGKIYNEIRLTMYNRLKNQGLKKSNPTYNWTDKGMLRYKKSKMIRYMVGYPLLPISYIQYEYARPKVYKVNTYTEEGRELIHTKYNKIEYYQKIKWLRENPIVWKRETIEYNDNRISLFIAQAGKCAITREELKLEDMECHHKIPYSVSKDDSYKNLILLIRDVHRLIHAKEKEVIDRYLNILMLDEKQLQKINQLRDKCGNIKIMYRNKVQIVQNTLF